MNPFLAAIPLLFKFLAIVLVWVVVTLVIEIKLGGWADDNYGTGGLILVVCVTVILSVIGLVAFLIMIVPYLV